MYIDWCSHGLPLQVLRRLFLFDRKKKTMRRLIAHLASTSPSKLPVLHRSLLPIFSLASSLYGFSLYIRRALYRWGFFRIHRQVECRFLSLCLWADPLFYFLRLPVPVMSVGNLTWGGNGKTPMTEFIARFFLESGVVPLILTRVRVFSAFL